MGLDSFSLGNQVSHVEQCFHPRPPYLSLVMGRTGETRVSPETLLSRNARSSIKICRLMQS